MGFERNYKVKIPCKQINKVRFYSMVNNTQELNPSWVTGFVDAKGCFSLSFVKDQKHETGWRVGYSFSINLHAKDQEILENIQKFFAGGGNF